VTVATMALDTQAAKTELAWLEGIPVGTVRTGVLFPALPVKLSWVCVVSQPHHWEFEARFCKQPLMRVCLQRTLVELTATIKE
jgi:hypothetical protein